MNAYSNSLHITSPDHLRFQCSEKCYFIAYLIVLDLLDCPTKMVLHFLIRKNTPILIFHNFSHRLPMPQSLVSSSIRLRFASANVRRRSTSAMGKMYRRRSKLWKNIRIGEIFFFFKNYRILLKIHLKAYLNGPFEKGREKIEYFFEAASIIWLNHRSIQIPTVFIQKFRILYNFNNWQSYYSFILQVTISLKRK